MPTQAVQPDTSSSYLGSANNGSENGITQGPWEPGRAVSSSSSAPPLSLGISMHTVQDGTVSSQKAVLEGLLVVALLESLLLGNNLVYVFSGK